MLKSINPSQWLSEFLKDRGLLKPSGKPLYEYQATESDYQTLRTIVIQYKDNSLYGYNSLCWSASFCLFCSLWYQRQYENSDGWSWHGIWHELGQELTPSQIERSIIKGIESYWLRPIKTYTERRNFLGTLFSEGGLPFKLLSNNDNKFGVALQRILKNVTMAKLLGESTEKLVTLNVQILPQAFKEPESIQLITLMAEKLMRLVELFGLENKTDPASYLDSVAPKWRDDFPIPLDTAIGTNIVNSWLQQASREGNKRRQLNKKLIVEHYLNESDLSIKSKLLLPNEFVLNIPLHTLKSSRIELFLAESSLDIYHLGVSYINATGEQALVKIRNRAVKVLRTSPEKQLSVVARQGGREITRWNLDNTCVFLNEIPVGFVKKDGELKYAGQATFSHKDELYLIVPQSCNYSLINGEITNWSHSIHSEKPNFLLLKGEMVITVEDDKYRIKSVSPVSTDIQINLFGEMLSYDTEPSATYLGVPKYRYVNSELAEEMELSEYIGGKSKSEIMLHERYGKQTFSLKNKNGETLFRKKIGLLPPGVKISTKSGVELGCGEIYIQTNDKMIYSLETPGVSFVKKDTNDGVCLLLNCDGIPPADLILKITPNLMATPISIKLPYPRQGAFVFDRGGKELQKYLSIDDLLGSRLHLFASAECAANFEIEIVLDNQGRCPPLFRHKFHVEDKPVIVSLYSFKDEINELLSLVPDLDTQVTINISSLTGNLQYRVNRYSSRIHETEDKRYIKVSSQQLSDVEGAKLLLMQMSNPERTPTELKPFVSEGVPTGHYLFPQVAKSEGPWLIVPSTESRINFRAKLLIGHEDSHIVNMIEHDELNDNVNSLNRAVQAYHPRFNPQIISGVIERMTENLQHSGWEYLLKLYNNFPNLPLTTFQVWREIVAKPKALLLCFYRFEANPQFMARIESEFPVLWQVTPPNMFVETYQQVLDWLEYKGVDKQYIEMIAKPWYEAILQHIPGFNDELINYFMTKKVDPKLKLPKSIMDQAADHWLQDLLRDHSEDELWPDTDGYELKRWYEKNSLEQIDIDSLHSFQNSVIYLPIFLAAVSSGKARLNDVYDDSANAIFKLKKVRDFDPNWFATMYAYHVIKFSDLG
ncbi:STY4851/ECs_5259 family protein [Shewanella gaetbuli]|uniref:STY4851/ECs_5259 family protein n=1 Tax=Shewanella gaetbuli TaxID=220752 RepID=A0A9X1ZPJ7_9GAMM|nr:STY4851/ECs_5259 family protein [Shewanella gaetbuli]MCL1143230.1 STY4851/ECs_5259 family protein [Shewanella gaetbuli]